MLAETLLLTKADHKPGCQQYPQCLSIIADDIQQIAYYAGQRGCNQRCLEAVIGPQTVTCRNQGSMSSYCVLDIGMLELWLAQRCAAARACKFFILLPCHLAQHLITILARCAQAAQNGVGQQSQVRIVGALDRQRCSYSSMHSFGHTYLEPLEEWPHHSTQ